MRFKSILFMAEHKRIFFVDYTQPQKDLNKLNS